MAYNRRTPLHFESVKQGTRSPSFESSSPHGRTPSRCEWTTPVGLQASPALTSPQYMAPPPIAGRPGRGTVVEYDTTPQGYSRGQNLNSAIPSSPSPLAEARYACVTETCRPSSATGSRSRRELASLMAPPPPPATNYHHQHHHHPSHRAASTVMMPPQPKVTYFDGCAAIVEERDPVTRDVVSRYRCGSLLGTGGFAQVFEFTELCTGARYACKVIDKKSLRRRGSEAKLRMEIDIHSNVKHSNIIQFFKSFQDDYYHYIILEQCCKKSLMELSKERGPFTREEIQFIMFQIISAVEYMHSKLIIHRDLKLGNIMIDFAGNMKVGDFGFASELNSISDRKTTTCGTPNYIAPEVLATDKTGLGYGLEADIWSLGVILYALAYGIPPFETKDINTTYNKIRQVDYSFPIGVAVSESCKDLIRLMLQRDPQKRPSPSDILRHNFLCLPQSTRSVPKSLIPSELRLSIPSNERQSPLWASPITNKSPFFYQEKMNNEYSNGLQQKQENEKGTAYELRMTLHEFLKENDCINETNSATLYSYSKDKIIQEKPPLPSIMLQSSIYCNKYGHGFLSYQSGKQYPIVFLNDKTKLVYDTVSDTVFYYGRSHMQATPIESGKRSPLLSEELVAKGFRDELVVFQNASTTLTNRNEGNETLSRIESAAAKKLAITKFFIPFLKEGTKDKRLVVMTCVLKNWSPTWDKILFSSSNLGDENTDIVYVKDSLMESLHELTGEFQDTDMQFLVARMSDHSFQISVRCDGVSPTLFCPKYNGLENSVNDFPWNFDIVIYGGFNALILFKTKQSLLALSFWDIRRDARTVNDGRIYFAAGTISETKSIMIPSAMLRAIAILLRKLRCCTDIVDCFC